MRIPASKIFRANPDGSITISRPIKIGGVTLDNVTFSRGVKVAGIDLWTLNDKELEIDDDKAEVIVVKGYYNQPSYANAG